MTQRSLVLLALAGCYGAAPPRPTTIPLPPIVPGAQIVVDSETSTTLETVPKKSVTCPSGHTTESPACITTKWSAVEPVTRTHSTLTYGDTQLDHAQFVVLTDGERDAKLARLERLTTRCRGARKFAITGLALLVAGPVTWAEGVATDTGVVSAIGLGVIAAGFGAWAYGYFAAGGRECNAAQDLYGQVEVRGLMGTTVVEGNAGELRELAARFNERLHVAR